MTMTTDKLKACPFCGGEAMIGSTAQDVVVRCFGCNARILRRHDTETDEIAIASAIKAWNTRAQAEDGEAVALGYVGARGLGELHAKGWAQVLRSPLPEFGITTPRYTHPPRAQEAGEDGRAVEVTHGLVDRLHIAMNALIRDRVMYVEDIDTLIEALRVVNSAREFALDASRYRWLRDQSVHFELPDRGTPYCVYGLGMGDSSPTWGTELDAMVDYCMSPEAALSAQRGEVE